MKYDAFISYSHAADATVAPALQAGLHRLARPWYALRALRVFRDETNLAAAPGLWPSIESALADSRCLILMASPAAAQSTWVRREIDWWLAHRSSARLLIVLSAGRLNWDEDAGDFDWSRTDALPSDMAGRCETEPKHVDLSWVRPGDRLGLDVPAFRAAVLDLAAPLHGKDKDLLDGDDVRQLRRTRWLARSSVAGLATLTVLATVAALLAWQQKELAEVQRAQAQQQESVALARQLAAQAALVLRQYPDRVPLAVLLALESVDRHPSFEGNQSLRAALTLLPERVPIAAAASASPRDRVRAIAFSLDGALLGVARDNGSAEVIAVDRRAVLATMPHDAQPGAVVEMPGGGFSWKAPGLGAEVVALAFSADGRLLATASNDGSARLWDSASGRQIARLEHEGRVASVAFHPTRPWLATGSADRAARLWDQDSGALVRRFDAGAEVRAVGFSPDGRRFAAIDTDGCVQLVDLGAPDAPVRRWCRGSAGLGLAFSADSRLLATANGDRAAVFDSSDGRRLFEASHLGRRDASQPEHFSWIDQVAFSPDGAWLASAGRDGSARIWDLAQGQELLRLVHPAPVNALAFGPTGAEILTASADGTARLWDLPSGRERLRAAQGGNAEAVAFSPREPLVASGASDGAVELWRLSSGDQFAAVRSGAGELEAVALAPDGRRMVGAGRDGVLRIWSTQGQALARKDELYGVEWVRFGADGQRLLVAARNPALGWLDLGSPQPEWHELARAGQAGDIAAGGQFIAARDRRQRRLLLWDAGDGRSLPVADDTDPWDIAIDARGAALATVHGEARGGRFRIRVRSLPGLQEIGTLAVDHQPVFALAPGGAILAVARRHREGERGPWHWHLDLVEVASGKVALRLAEDRSPAWLRFSADGRYLFTRGEAAADQARELRVWSTADSRLLARLRHEGDLWALRFAASGDVLATSTGGLVHLWSLPEGVLQGQVESDVGFSDIAISGDGRSLLTGSRDGRLTLWRWRTADLRAEACRRLTRNLDADEWLRYLGGRPYRPTCPSAPPAAAGAGAASAAIAAQPGAPR